MTARRALLRIEWAVLAALAFSCAGVAVAQEAAPKTTTARRTTTTSAGTKTKSKTRTMAAKPSAGKDGAARRLTDVHIEGEMPVPQVLFITARDQRRYVDFQHQRYLRDSRALGAATATPTRVTAAGDDTPH